MGLFLESRNAVLIDLDAFYALDGRPAERLSFLRQMREWLSQGRSLIGVDGGVPVCTWYVKVDSGQLLSRPLARLESCDG